MTDPGYNLVEIVDAVRRAGNPHKAALDALADTDGLTDAALLDALGVERLCDLPTTPYPDAPGKAPDTAPPIPADKAASAADALAGRLEEIDDLRAEMGATLDWLERFADAWSHALTDLHLFSDEQVEALASVTETSRAWLAGWDALRGMLGP